MSNFIQCIVKRDGEDTIAIVNAEVVTVLSKKDLQQKVIQACTAWIKRTKAGKTAWKESSADLNVGDLSEWQGNAELQEDLRAVGIVSLSIVTYSSDDASAWRYDDVLVDEDTLNDEEEEVP